jgi:hypothetical protein
VLITAPALLASGAGVFTLTGGILGEVQQICRSSIQRSGRIFDLLELSSDDIAADALSNDSVTLTGSRFQTGAIKNYDFTSPVHD